MFHSILNQYNSRKIMAHYQLKKLDLFYWGFSSCWYGVASVFMYQAEKWAPKAWRAKFKIVKTQNRASLDFSEVLLQTIK